MVIETKMIADIINFSLTKQETEGEVPQTPVSKQESGVSQGGGGGLPAVGEERQVKASKTKSNGEVPDTTTTANESTPVGTRM